MRRLRVVVCDELVELTARAARGRSNPLTVAIDGRSGAGKSTIAARLADRLDAVVIDGDDFYAGGTAAEWDAMTPAERAAHCIDWRRQRRVLEALARGEEAIWHPYDWEADDGRLAELPRTSRPASVVILEGAYSARSELADLLDLRVLVDVPDVIRLWRLDRREGAAYRAEWEARWASAEDHYFTHVRRPADWDLVLRG